MNCVPLYTSTLYQTHSLSVFLKGRLTQIPTKKRRKTYFNIQLCRLLWFYLSRFEIYPSQRFLPPSQWSWVEFCGAHGVENVLKNSTATPFSKDSVSVTLDYPRTSSWPVFRGTISLVESTFKGKLFLERDVAAELFKSKSWQWKDDRREREMWNNMQRRSLAGFEQGTLQLVVGALNPQASGVPHNVIFHCSEQHRWNCIHPHWTVADSEISEMDFSKPS